MVGLADDGLAPLFAACFIFVAVFLVGITLYFFASNVLPSSLQSLAHDYIKTLVVCAYPFGHAVMWRFYGGTGFLLLMVPLMVVTIRSLPKGEANPVGVWVKYFRGVISLSSCLVITGVQLAAGLTAYQLGIYLYQTELHEHFSLRLQGHNAGTCNSALNVPLIQGFLVETLGVTYDAWFGSQTLSADRRVNVLLKVINTGLVVTLGFHLTGMFMHPPKATGLTFGCGNTPLIGHLVVYWLGPLLGAWLCSRLGNTIKLQRVTREKKE